MYIISKLSLISLSIPIMCVFIENEINRRKRNWK